MAKTFTDVGMGKDVVIKGSNCTKNNTKNWSTGLHEIEKFLHDKGKKLIGQETYRVGKICANHISDRVLTSKT